MTSDANTYYFYRLSGTKSDLRVPKSNKFVTTSEGKKLKKKIGAYAFVECSAKQNENLHDVFVEAVHAVTKKPEPKTCNCQLM